MSSLSFDDHNAAMRMRDTVKKIVAKQVNEQRPDIRVGRVYSYDDSILTAQILFAGHTIDNLISVQYAQNMMPANAMITDFAASGYNALGDVVRVSGSGASLWIADYVTGAPRITLPTPTPVIIPAIGYRGTTPQGITTSTLTTVAIAGTVAYDYGGFSIAANVVTVTNAGLYEVIATVSYVSTFTTTCRSLLRVETWTGADPGVGSATIIAEQEQVAVNATFPALNAIGHASLVAGAKVRAYTFQSNGTTLNIASAGEPSRLALRQLA